MELLIGVALAVVLAVLFVVLVLLVLPVRVDLSGAHLVRAIDRVALAMGLLEACPSCGVPAGASIPNHNTDSQSGTPASTIVGRSGKKMLRLASVTASGTSLPVGKCGDTDEAGEK